MSFQKLKLSATLIATNLLFFGGSVNAAEGATTEADSATFWYLLVTYGKWINLTLLILAFIALSIFFHALLTTRRRLTAPKDFLRKILDDIASGNIESAIKRSEENRSLLSGILLPAIRMHDQSLERLHHVTENSGRRAISSIRQEITYLANIGVLCPMLGLLGTVMGMITAFESFAAEIEISMQQAMLTAAIGKAMITTAAGLLVGIPCMAAYFYASGRINRVSDDLEIAAETVISTLREHQ